MYRVALLICAFVSLADALALGGDNLKKKAAAAGEQIAEGAEDLAERAGEAWVDSAPQR